jgi:nitroreductase
VDLVEALQRRRMVRSFADTPLDAGLVGTLLAGSLRAPTAGNARGTAWLALEGAEQAATYWAHTTTDEWRQRSRRWPGLSRAPVVALSLASPSLYVQRYGEPDKAGSGLGPPITTGPPGGGDPDRPGGGGGGTVGGSGAGGGTVGSSGAGSGGTARGGGEAAWPVPYWFGDAAGAVMALLLLATAEGLGACFLGNFRGEAELLPALGVPAGWRLYGAVLLGHPDGADPPSPSLSRPGPSRAARVHRAHW